MIGTAASPEVPMCLLLMQRFHASLCIANISFVFSLENSSLHRIEFLRLLCHSLPTCNSRPLHSWDRALLLSSTNAYIFSPQVLMILPTQPNRGYTIGAAYGREVPMCSLLLRRLHTLLRLANSYSISSLKNSSSLNIEFVRLL